MPANAQIIEGLQSEWDRCTAEGLPLALLMIALDHPVDGEESEVITHLERALRVHCGRDRDRVIRRADGQFVAILPDTVPPGARHVAGQIVEAMQQTPHPPATVSVGVAAMAPSDQDSPDTLFNRAQRALRAAQDQGGNRCAGGSTPAPPPKGAIAQLRELLAKPEKESGLKRRTD